MKRHYTRLIDGGYRCVLCRQEFGNKADFAQHCSKSGKCKHPMTLGYHVEIDVSPYRWAA